MTIGQNLDGYYRLHARIYDATRWCFLFGRQSVLKTVIAHTKPRRVLEIGCGTGRNLEALAKLLPEAEITGLDLSAEMLGVAMQKIGRFGGRVKLIHRRYDQSLGGDFDLVLFSYALSMFNPGWSDALYAARSEPGYGGHVAVVDFHGSRSRWFRRWMGMNHVCMEAHLLPELKRQFEPLDARVRYAWFGLWQYVLFVGKGRQL